MPFAFNPFTGNLDVVKDLSGYVPYTGATATVNLGANNLFATQIKTGQIYTLGAPNPNQLSIDVNVGRLYNFSSGNPSVDYYNSQLLDDNGVVSLDWFSGRYLKDSTDIQSIDYQSRILKDSLGLMAVNWANTLGVIVATAMSIGSGAAPSAALHVQKITEQLRLGYDATNYHTFTVSSASDLAIQTGVNGTASFRVNNSSGTAVFSADTTNVRLGVGTLTPSARLHIQTTSEQFRVGYDGTNATRFVQNSSNQLDLIPLVNAVNGFNVTKSDGATRVLIVDTSSNRVGINTTPSAVLHPLSTAEQLRLARDGSAYTRFLQGLNGLNIYPAVNNTFGFTVSKADGATYVLIVDSTNTRVGIGTGPQAVLHTLGTTEQLRVGYNSSNYLSVTTSSGGAITYDAVGTGTVYQSFLDKVGIGSGTPTAQLHVFATTEQLRLQYDGSNYFSTTVSSSGQVTWDSIGSNPKFVISDQLDVNSVLNVNYGAAGSVAAARVLLTADTSNVTTAVCLDMSSNGSIGRLTASTLVQKWTTSNVRVIQTSTAGYTISDVDVTETSTGSGVKQLADWKVGGVSKFTVSNAGAVGIFGDVTFADAKNIVLNTTTGTKIGTATTQKIGFYNATPVVQGASVADATGGVVIDAEARTAINALISRIEALGLIATI